MYQQQPLPCTWCWHRDDVELIDEVSFHPYLSIHTPRRRTRSWDGGGPATPPTQQLQQGRTRGGEVRLSSDDTVIVHNLPAKWFELGIDRAGRGLYEPSCSPLHRLFSIFGPLKDIDIEMKTELSGQALPGSSPSGRSGDDRQKKTAVDLLSLDDDDSVALASSVAESASTLRWPVSPREMPPLGPVLDVWARFRSHEDFKSCMHGLVGAFLSSVTEEGYLIELDVEVDKADHFARKRKARKNRGGGASSSPKSVTLSSRQQQPSAMDSTSSSTVPLSMTLTPPRGAAVTPQQTVHPLLQQKVEDIRMELAAQVRVLRKGVQAQRIILREEIENRKPSAWRIQALEANNGTINVSSESQEFRDAEFLIEQAAIALEGLLGPDVIASSTADVDSRRREAKKAIRAASKALDKLEARLRRTIGRIVEAEMQRPPLEGFLIEEGMTYFLEAVKRKRGAPLLIPPQHGPDKYGLTILAPVNDAFLGDPLLFEEECWDLHIIEGIHTIASLGHLKEVLPISFQLPHLLRIQMDPKDHGHRIWRKKETEPIMKAKVLRADVFCQPRIVVHVVDRILFPLA